MELKGITTFFRKYVEPFMVIGVVIILLLIWSSVSQGNKLRTEISQNCGWEEEDYRCFCEKSAAIEILNKIENNQMFSSDEGIEYVQMGG